MADRWFLTNETPSFEGVFAPSMLNPSRSFSGYTLRRCGYTDAEIQAAERKECERCLRDNEKYKPREWVKPLYFGDSVRFRSAHGELVMRESGVCLAARGKFATKMKDGKRVWQEFRSLVFQPLEDSRLLGQSRLFLVGKKLKAKVAA